jgi:hypothetical protein
MFGSKAIASHMPFVNYGHKSFINLVCRHNYIKLFGLNLLALLNKLDRLIGSQNNVYRHKTVDLTQKYE